MSVLDSDSARSGFTLPVFACAAAIAALQDTEFQNLTWKWLPEARNQLFQGVASIPGLTPLEGTVNYLLVESQQEAALRHFPYCISSLPATLKFVVEFEGP